MHVFKTKEGAGAVEIVGVGLIGPDGKGGIPIEEAARRGMSELLEKNEDGSLKIDPDTGTSIPLKGKALEQAAREWAERHDVEVVNYRKGEDELVRELGVAPDRPPARDVSIAEYEATYAGLEPVNTNPDDMVFGGVHAGVPHTPARGEPGEAEQRVAEQAREAAEQAAEEGREA